MSYSSWSINRTFLPFDFISRIECSVMCHCHKTSLLLQKETQVDTMVLWAVLMQRLWAHPCVPDLSVISNVTSNGPTWSNDQMLIHIAYENSKIYSELVEAPIFQIQNSLESEIDSRKSLWGSPFSNHTHLWCNCPCLLVHL